jgi:hypothetical protein
MIDRAAALADIGDQIIIGHEHGTRAQFFRNYFGQRLLRRNLPQEFTASSISEDIFIVE